MKPTRLKSLARRLATWREITRDVRRIAIDVAGIGLALAPLLYPLGEFVDRL